MIISHIPAGYVITKLLQKKLNTRIYLWIGILGGVFPDFDIIWFYLIDQGMIHHHDYWTHIPFYWILIASLSLLTILLLKKKNLLTPWIIFFAGIFSHLLFDTVVGDIKWLFPFQDQFIHFFLVTSRYDFWIWNFVIHWSFLIEIFFIVASIYLIIKSRAIKK